MPRELVCGHCQHRLQVSDRYSEPTVVCPHCKHSVIVPPAAPQNLVVPMQHEHVRNQEAPAPPPAPSLPPTGQPAPLASSAPPPLRPRIDVHREVEPPPPRPAAVDEIRVARRVIIMQGVLLGAMTLAGLAAGMFIARSHAPRDGTAGQACLVFGMVRHSAAEPARADGGAVVLLLPRDRLPDRGQKMKVAGLRPSDGLLPEDHTSRAVLASLGGDYGRASPEGFYYVRAQQRGPYFLLVLSANAAREVSASLDRQDLAEIGRYVDRAAELIGTQRYRWQEIDLQNDTRLDVTL